MQSAGAGNVCPRCQKKVYFAEEIIAMTRHWHKSCFCCANQDCKKRLDSRTCADHNGEAYCTHCYGKFFGPKGYGYGQGAGTLSMDTGNANEIATSNISSYAQAQVAPILDGGRNSRSSTDSAGSGPVVHGNHRQNSSSAIGLGGCESCRRCGKPVYMAERLIGAGAAWHKITCFTCNECLKRLESTTLCEREGEIFCKTCYGKKFGPKGYGFGIGAGALQMQQ